jgi:LysR family transcriptional activator of nhaA
MLNYKHLHYFWMVAKHGGLSKASELLYISPQSISSQLKQLEESIGEVLFRRAGRSLELTEVGRMVYEHADRAFSAGEELRLALQDKSGSRQARFRVAVSNVVGRSLAYKILRPAFQMQDAPRLVCKEGRLADLLADLAVGRLELVISDRAIDSSMNVRSFNHLLGECGVEFLAAPSLARVLRKRFPYSLDGAPALLHGEDSAMRARCLRWFDQKQIRPRVVAEFDDTALLKAFAQEAAGFMAAPRTVVPEICAMHGLERVGGTDEIIDQVYGISTERRITHPAVVAISQAARNETYGRLAQLAKAS